MIVIIICNQANKKSYCKTMHVIIKYLHHYKWNSVLKMNYKTFVKQWLCPELGTCKIKFWSIFGILNNKFLRHVYLFIDIITRMYPQNYIKWFKFQNWNKHLEAVALGNSNTIQCCVMFSTEECQSYFYLGD